MEALSKIFNINSYLTTSFITAGYTGVLFFYIRNNFTKYKRPSLSHFVRSLPLTLVSSAAEEYMFRYPLGSEKIPVISLMSMMLSAIPNLIFLRRWDVSHLSQDIQDYYNGYEDLRKMRYNFLISLIEFSPVLAYIPLRFYKNGITQMIYSVASSAAFALFHINNHKTKNKRTLWISATVQGTIGLCLSLITFKYGLGESIFSHVMYNMIVSCFGYK